MRMQRIRFGFCFWFSVFTVDIWRCLPLLFVCYSLGFGFCQYTHFCGPLKQSTAANIPCERWLVIEKVIYLSFIKFQQK